MKRFGPIKRVRGLLARKRSREARYHRAQLKRKENRLAHERNLKRLSEIRVVNEVFLEHKPFLESLSANALFNICHVIENLKILPDVMVQGKPMSVAAKFRKVEPQDYQTALRACIKFYKDYTVSGKRPIRKTPAIQKRELLSLENGVNTFVTLRKAFPGKK